MTDSIHDKRYNVVSLFSGAMGLDIGLEKSERFLVLACVENDENALRTIEANAKHGNLANEDVRLYGDIRTLEPMDVLSDLGLKVGELDLLSGGPPCQSFSTAGRRGTVQDPRGTLIWEFFRFVKAMRPKFFLMENVRGLLSAAIRHRPIAERGDPSNPLTHEEEPGSVVRLLLKDFEAEGYRADAFEVNAVNYGAPQLRERVLFIGNDYNTHTDFPKPTHVPFEAYGSMKGQKVLDGENVKMEPFRTLGDALEGLHEENPVVLDFSHRKKRYLTMVPPGGNWRALPDQVQRESLGRAYFAKGGRSGWWRRLSYDLPCPCLLTLPNHASTSLCHPTEVRALSAREYARIQEFPDSWVFEGAPADLYKQIGNAVPVRLGMVAGEVIASELDAVNKKRLARVLPGERIRPSCIIYVKSHVRTRRWFKDGEPVVNGSGCEEDSEEGGN